MTFTFAFSSSGVRCFRPCRALPCLPLLRLGFSQLLVRLSNFSFFSFSSQCSIGAVTFPPALFITFTALLLHDKKGRSLT